MGPGLQKEEGQERVAEVWRQQEIEHGAYREQMRAGDRTRDGVVRTAG